MVKHTRDTAFIAGVVYFIQGALGLSGITLPLYLRGLGWSVGDVTAVTAIAALPWIFKIFYGLLSDTLPLFGYRRKTYLVLASFISASGWLVLSLLPTASHMIIGAMMLSNLGFAATDVITDGLVVEHSTGFSGPIYQAIAWGSRSIGAVTSGILAGWLAANWPPHYVFLLTMCLPLVIACCVMFIHEKKVEKSPFGSALVPIHRCFQLLFSPNLKYFTIILFTAAISASFAVPLFFYMRETLKFPETLLGILTSLGWGGAMIGSMIYARWLRAIPPKTTLRWAILINSLNIFSAFLIHSRMSAFIVVFTGGILGCLVMLPIVSSAAALTHQSGVEGTLFAVLMSFFNLGQILFGYFGSKVYTRVGLYPLIAISGIAALLALAFASRLKLDPVSSDGP